MSRESRAAVDANFDRMYIKVRKPAPDTRPGTPPRHVYEIRRVWLCKRCSCMVMDCFKHYSVCFNDQKGSPMQYEVRLWQLAFDEDAYGEQAGWWILVTPSGENEVAGPWPTEDEARAYVKAQGWRLV